MTSRKVNAALRPFLPADAPALIAIFRASIDELTGDDYTEDQREAWAAAADDEAAFAERLKSGLTLIATVDGEPAAFATLKDNEHVEFLFVHPAYVSQGLASSLLDALEKLARNRGAKRLTTDASDTALDFFGKRGFVMKQRNSVHRHGEWLASTSMEKELSGESPKPH